MNKKLHEINPSERISRLVEHNLIDQSDAELLSLAGALPRTMADSLIENFVCGFEIPMGLANHFLIDEEEFIIPMVVEESSVIAAASYGAKLARMGGGFFCEPVSTIATAQVELKKVSESFVAAFESHKAALREVAQAAVPSLLKRGGSVESISLRQLRKQHYCIHIEMNTLEAMGANLVNTIAEAVGHFLTVQYGCQIGLRILTNLTIQRLVNVSCKIPFTALERKEFSGNEVARGIAEAWEFATLCPFRAATHNKGVMNGIDPVVIATGNDWRAVEAGCHAWAAMSAAKKAQCTSNESSVSPGYAPLTTWKTDNSSAMLIGKISVPIAVGTVGGVTKLHPLARVALKILRNPSSARLSQIIASAGLAQNLSALRALACEGIQQGHMALHQKNLSLQKSQPA